MIKNIFLIIIIFSFSNCFSQDFQLRVTPFVKSKIIYKDSTSQIGLLRMASSAFDLRIKSSEEEKTKKIDYKLIDKIISNPETNKERIFQYLDHNYGKFRIFAELIYTDILSIYISLPDAENLFYSDFDRQNISEMMAQARFEANSNFRLKKADTIELPNGKQIALPLSYSYYLGLNSGFAFGATPNLTFYLSKEGDSKLYRVEKNKRFLKRSNDLISDCPILLDELKQENITLDDLTEFIEYYKNICLNNQISEH